MLRLLTVVACGSRTVIDAVFGSYRIGETSYAPQLLRCLRPGMMLLADRNFAVTTLIEQIHASRADLLIRCKDNRNLPAVRYLPDGTWLAPLGSVTVRVIDARITVHLGPGGHHRSGRYRLITTLTDPHRHPAGELVELYDHRWEIETSFRELKSSILGGRVLRARTPTGVSQEVYATLIVYQALRTAITDALLTTDRAATRIEPLRMSFTIALTTARDQIHRARAVLSDTTVDLVGRIGHAVLANPLPPRRCRTSPRVVKRAISKHRAKGIIDRTTYTTHITTNVLPRSLTNPPNP